MKKIIIIGLISILFLFTTSFTSPVISCKNKTEMLYNRGSAIIASIYLEIDPNTTLAQYIVSNYHKSPNGLLTNIHITIDEPNQDYYLFIGPFFKTIFRQILYNDSQSKMVFPDKTVTLYMPVFYGDVREWEQTSGRPPRLIVDGWVLLLCWKY